MAERLPGMPKEGPGCNQQPPGALPPRPHFLCAVSASPQQRETFDHATKLMQLTWGACFINIHIKPNVQIN